MNLTPILKLRARGATLDPKEDRRIRLALKRRGQVLLEDSDGSGQVWVELIEAEPEERAG